MLNQAYLRGIPKTRRGLTMFVVIKKENVPKSIDTFSLSRLFSFP